MAKRKTTARRSKSLKNNQADQELDSIYLLKLVLYLILGSFWLRVTNGESYIIPLPVGFVVGLIFAFHDHFKVDRKIEFALLLVAMFVSFWLPMGLTVAL